MGFSEYAAELKAFAAAAEESLLVVDSVGSTSSFARRLVDRFREHHWRPPDLAIVAWSQTHGRGRGDHGWLSPPGSGVYVTSLRGVALSRAQLAAAPIAVAVALAEAVGEWLPRPPGLKWPNDLLVDGRKLGGVLIEAVSTGHEEPMLLVGVGLNYSATAAGERWPAEATALAEAVDEGRLPSLAAATFRVIEAIDDAVEAPAAATIIDRYRELSVHRPGESIRVRIRDEIVAGRFVAFDATGHLKLETRDGARRISTGELID